MCACLGSWSIVWLKAGDEERNVISQSRSTQLSCYSGDLGGRVYLDLYSVVKHGPTIRAEEW